MRTCNPSSSSKARHLIRGTRKAVIKNKRASVTLGQGASSPLEFTLLFGVLIQVSNSVIRLFVGRQPTTYLKLDIPEVCWGRRSEERVLFRISVLQSRRWLQQEWSKVDGRGRGGHNSGLLGRRSKSKLTHCGT